MKETEIEAIERRKETYGCDGKCGFCMGIDTCEETRKSEGLAELFIFCIPITIIIIILMIIF